MDITRPTLHRRNEVDRMRLVVKLAAALMTMMSLLLLAAVVYVVVHFLLKVW